MNSGVRLVVRNQRPLPLAAKTSLYNTNYSLFSYSLFISWHILKEKEWESYSLLICLLQFCWINGHTNLNLLIIQEKKNYVRIQQKPWNFFLYKETFLKFHTVETVQKSNRKNHRNKDKINMPWPLTFMACFRFFNEVAGLN